MPKLPGRSETRRTVVIQDAVVTSFKMIWESPEKRLCAITDCHHRIVEECGDAQVAIVADLYDGKYVGWVCSHHVDEIFAVNPE